jgi:hypothetical protein
MGGDGFGGDVYNGLALVDSAKVVMGILRMRV